MIPKIVVTVLALWFCVAGTAHAQSPQARDPVAEALVPPDVVMAHQQALGLSDAQRTAIQTYTQGAQQRFMQLQWKLAAASEKLIGLLKQNHVDQPKALAAFDAVLDLEREVKHTQITLMIQVKNELTTEQQGMARRFAAGGAK